jgi:glutamyl-Q tRNA(Asp) synthetase
MTRTITRFAPSPTGRLHLGHAYSALLAHRFARERGGMFLLRIEDIDPGRCRQEFVAGIMEDLAWLGISWGGEIVRQSARLPIYAAALEELKTRGLAYPCFCTRSAIAAEISASAAAPHGPEGPVYPGTCRRLPAKERERRLAGEPHAWRIDMTAALSRVSDDPLVWRDHDQPVAANPARFGDIVLARKDAPTSYHLAVTVDDAAAGVTDIVRGADLREATHVQRLLQALLNLPTPAYHHHPLIVDESGQRLAKRTGAPALADLCAAGEDPHKLAENLITGRFPAGYSLAAP